MYQLDMCYESMSRCFVMDSNVGGAREDSKEIPRYFT